jgi:hypothetical protein
MSFGSSFALASAFRAAANAKSLVASFSEVQ